MGGSHLIREDKDWLYLYMYVHNDPDELPEWYDPDKHSDQLIESTETVGYELRIDYKVNKETYEIEILSIT